MNGTRDEQIGRFVEACHEIAERGLVRASCGNLSMRLDAHDFLITTTGSAMRGLTREHVAVRRLADGAGPDGKTPSSEFGFHLGILRLRPDVNVVLHFQTPAATACACRPADDTDFSVIPEVPYYIGPVGRVPYFAPGSLALADAVTAAMRGRDLVQLTNHGQVTVAEDLSQAIQQAEFFELACEILLLGGKTVAPLSAEAVDELRAMRARNRRRGV